MLSEHDAHLLKLLEPVPRSSIPEWLDLHDQLVTAVAQAQQDGVSWLGGRPVAQRGGRPCRTPSGLRPLLCLCLRAVQSGQRPTDVHALAAAAVFAAPSTDVQGADVVLYGDSILEAFRGTTMGFDSTDKYQANKQAWEREAPPRWVARCRSVLHCICTGALHPKEAQFAA